MYLSIFKIINFEFIRKVVIRLNFIFGVYCMCDHILVSASYNTLVANFYFFFLVMICFHYIDCYYWFLSFIGYYSFIIFNTNLNI